MKKSCLKIKCDLKRSECPITNTLELIGDKWTLLVIRDMLFLNKKTFNEFLSSPEKIATNILTERLKRLEDYGLVTKTAYGNAPHRYQYILTPHGKALRPVLMELLRWGNSHLEGTRIPPAKLLA